MEIKEKLKVYIVADAYRWHELSVYPDIFQKWIDLMCEEKQEKNFTFMTKQMTESEYDKEIKILSALNKKEDVRSSTNKPKKKPLRIFKNDEQADIIEFPGGKNGKN